MEDFEKLVCPGQVQTGLMRRGFAVMKVIWKFPEISFKGVIVTKQAIPIWYGNWAMDPPYITLYDEGWGNQLYKQFLEVCWNNENNLWRPNCEHQIGEAWAPVFVPALNTRTVMLRQDEHALGLLRKRCPECGYRYGTKWRSMIPNEADLDFIQSLPDAADKGWI